MCGEELSLCSLRRELAQLFRYARRGYDLMGWVGREELAKLTGCSVWNLLGDAVRNVPVTGSLLLLEEIPARLAQVYVQLPTQEVCKGGLSN